MKDYIRDVSVSLNFLFFLSYLRASACLFEISALATETLLIYQFLFGHFLSILFF